MESDESGVIKMKNKMSLSKYRLRRKKGVAHGVRSRLAMLSVNNSQKKDMDPIEGPWSPKEDEMLLNLFRKHRSSWSLISKSIPGRSAKSCSSRWFSLQSFFMPEEDESNGDITISDHNIFIQPASLGDINRGHRNSYIHDLNLSLAVGGASDQAPSIIGDMALATRSQNSIHEGNSSHEVGGVVSGQAPSLSDMVRANMSSGGTHSFSRDHSAPSWNALSKRDLSQTTSDSDNSSEVSSAKKCFEPVRPIRLNRSSSKKRAKMSRFFEA